MSRRLALALIAVTGCGGSAKFADLELGPRRAAFTEEVYATTLANGLRVVLVPDARTNLVTVGVHYEVGSADDPVHDAGLAHYVEHVVFDAAFRGAGGDALRDVALEQNAMTQLDRTYFYASGLDGDLDRLLDAAARRFEATCEDLDAAVLARERDVVLEEVKYRSRYDTSFGAVLAAIWGGSHPYARDPGAAEFADISRARLCEFIDRHYGPASAVLAVTGHVAEADLRRIRARFEAIPARPRPASPAPSTLPTGTARVSIAGLERPTAMIVFPVPGEGGDADGIVGLLDGMSWWLPRAAPSRSMSLFVIGERRARAVVAFAETEDAARLDELAQAMRRMLARLPIAGFEERKERARIAAAADLDDVLGAGDELAAMMVHRGAVTRFRELTQLDAATEDQLRRWLDPAKSRAVLCTPADAAAHDAARVRVAALATALHHVELIQTPIALDAALPPIPERRGDVIDYRLDNGLRVLLEPDPDSLELAARLVIDTGPGSDRSDGAARSAALFLEPTDGRDDGSEAATRVAWYRTVGSPVLPWVSGSATTFSITGFSLFADWHVWNLAWTVLHGRFPSWLDTLARAAAAPATKPTKPTKPPEPPGAPIVVRDRLAGATGRPRAFSVAELEAFRSRAYRPDAATLIVTGKFEVAAMRDEIAVLFGGWSGPGAGAAAPAPAPAAARRAPAAIAVSAADAMTLQVAVGFASDPAAAVSDRVARQVVAAMLQDRLRVVREGLGVSYVIHAGVEDDALLITGHVEPAYATEAATAIAAVIAQVRDGDTAIAADFARARKRLFAHGLARPLGARARADALERIALDRGTAADLDRELAALRTLDLATVQRLAARELAADHAIIAVRGRADAVDLALRALGADPATIEPHRGADR